MKEIIGKEEHVPCLVVNGEKAMNIYFKINRRDILGIKIDK